MTLYKFSFKIILLFYLAAVFGLGDFNNEINNNYLNWQVADNICQGRFVNTFDNNKLAIKPDLNIKQIDFWHNKKITGSDIFLSGPASYLTAVSGQIDKAVSDKIKLQGPIKYYAANYFINAKKAKISLKLNSSQWSQAWFRFNTLNKHFLWGYADKISHENKKLWQLEKTKVSMCSAKLPLWHIESDKILINKKTGVAKFYHNWLYLYHLPLITLPYLSLPINKQRKTGWLIPTIGRQKYVGNFVRLFWYLNIAKNQDLKITPWVSQYSGFNVKFDWRYLSKFGFSKIAFFYVPHDRAFAEFQQNTKALYSADPLRQTGVFNLNSAKPKRWHWSLQHTYADKNNNIDIDWQAGSDDDVTRHFPTAFLLQDLQYLPQKISWEFNKNNFSSKLSWYQWQVLHSLLWQPVPNVYQKTPQWHGFWFANLTNYLNAKLDLDVGKFTIDSLLGHADLPSGNRVVLEPELTFIHDLWQGRLEARIGAHLLYVHANKDFNINIPRLAVNWQTSAWTSWPKAYINQLVFKMFYALAPFKQQSSLPHFELDWQPQLYNQLFQWNRFSGLDWQGDTNQIATGLELNSYNKLTKELVGKIAIAQGFAFSKHKLCLDANCYADVLAHQHPSALHLLANYQVTDKYQLKTDLAWDWFGSQSITGQLENELKLNDNQKINLAYNFIKMPNDPVFDGFIWPWQNNLQVVSIGLHSNWNKLIQTKAKLNWDLEQKQLSDAEFELVWHGCCSALHLGLVRSYNHSLSFGNFSFENRVYMKISLLSGDS